MTGEIVLPPTHPRLLLRTITRLMPLPTAMENLVWVWVDGRSSSHLCTAHSFQPHPPFSICNLDLIRAVHGIVVFAPPRNVPLMFR